MRALFATAPGKLKIMDVPRPEPGPFEALVQTEACAICNSTDTKLLHGEFCPGTWPMLLGHEVVGRVVKLGQGVHSFKVGDRVLRGFLADSAVPLPGGRSCWGGFAEYNLVTDVWARDGVTYNSKPHPQQIVPPEIDAVHATALITLKENLSSVSNADVAGRSVAIVGTGPVAQSMALFARLLGAGPLVVFGRQARWAERFQALGVDAYVAGSQRPALVERVLASGGFERVLEAVGSREALHQCVELAGTRGQVCVYGIAPASAPYDPADRERPNVHDLRVAEAEVHEQLLGMVARGQVRLADWVSHVLPLDEFEFGFHMVWAKEANKVVLTFGA